MDCKVALPELIRQRVEQQLTAYCDRKVPKHVRHQVRLAFDFRGNNVTLYEEREAISKPGSWTRMPIAQFRFNEKASVWSLYCADRSDRWHIYRHAEPVKDIGALLQALDADTTGIFWG